MRSEHRGTLQRTRAPIGLSLSGVMTFFFNVSLLPVPLQPHQQPNSSRRAALGSRGAAISNARPRRPATALTQPAASAPQMPRPHCLLCGHVAASASNALLIPYPAHPAWSAYFFPATVPSTNSSSASTRPGCGSHPRARRPASCAATWQKLSASTHSSSLLLPAALRRHRRELPPRHSARLAAFAVSRSRPHRRHLRHPRHRRHSSCHRRAICSH